MCAPVFYRLLIKSAPHKRPHDRRDPPNHNIIHAMIPRTRPPHIIQQQPALEIDRREELPRLEPRHALARHARRRLRPLPQLLERRVALLHHLRQLGLVPLLLRERLRHEGARKEAVDLVGVLAAVEEQLLAQGVGDGADGCLGGRVGDVAW